MRLDEIAPLEVWNQTHYADVTSWHLTPNYLAAHFGPLNFARCVFCGEEVTHLRYAGPAMMARCEEVLHAHALTCGRRWLRARLRAGDPDVVMTVFASMGITEIIPERAPVCVERQLVIEQRAGATAERLDSLIGLLEVLCGPLPESRPR